MCGGGDSIGATPEMKEESKINAEMFNWYQTNYKPLLEKWTAKVLSPDEEAAQEKHMAGEINAATMRNITPGIASDNPVNTEKKLLALAGGEAGAKVKGQAAVRSRQIGERQNIINIGQGQAADTATGTATLASASLGAEESQRQIAEEVGASKENVWGAIVGAGAAVTLQPLLDPQGGSSSSINPMAMDPQGASPGAGAEGAAGYELPGGESEQGANIYPRTINFDSGTPLETL